MLNASPVQGYVPLLAKNLSTVPPLPEPPKVITKAYFISTSCVAVEIKTQEPADIVVGLFTRGKFITLFQWHVLPGNNINSVRKDFSPYQHVHVGVADWYGRRLSELVTLELPGLPKPDRFEVILGGK